MVDETLHPPNTETILYGIFKNAGLLCSFLPPLLSCLKERLCGDNKSLIHPYACLCAIVKRTIKTGKYNFATFC